ncbi:MAG TPA: TonB-dependent receptor, partial [Steroidobacteraceae bacterium]|nr:TonB-dependent receptor [Steroidobacteraceae bacterium]
MSKESRKLRRDAARAGKSRATELAIFVAGATMLAPWAMAQDAAAPAENTNTTTKSDDDLTEILVTGIRKALETSQEIKKNADTVVDSITATDIGAFPDKSVAEALQRMTGVAVTRFAAAGDTTHFSAEPSGVVIRGLPQVRSEFNGRDSFNANSSRGLSFGDVSPELMAGVDTYKNATADMIEGGIAGTVNLRTHVPFDSEGFVMAVSGEVGFGSLAKEARPAGSFLLSNRWDTGVGEFGIMANAAYSEVVTESQGVQLLRIFQTNNVAAYGGGVKWIPGGIDIRSNTYDRTRKGASFATQWRSPSDSLLATLQYNRSEYVNTWEEYSLTAGVGNSQNPQNLILTNEFATHPAGTDPFEFDSQGMFVRGTINAPANDWAGATNNPTIAHPDGYRQGSATASPDWVCYTWGGSTNKPCPNTRGAGLSADTRYATTENLTEDYSLNLRWDVSERVGLNFDVQWIDSTVTNYDNSTDNKTAADIHLDLEGGPGGKPSFFFTQPTGYGWTEGGFSDPQNWFHEWTMEHIEDSQGEELAARIDADIKLDSGWMDSLRVGVRAADRDQQVNWSRYNWGSVQPLWGLQDDVDFFLNQPQWVGTWAPHDLGPNLVGGGVYEGGVMLHPLMSDVKNYQRTIDLYGNGMSNSWTNLGARGCAVEESPGALYCPVESMDVVEDTRAAYIMLKFGGDETSIGGVSVRGNIGVRWVKTDVSSTGGAQFPLYQTPSAPAPGEPVDPRSLADPNDIAFQNSGNYTAEAGDSNTNMLPSLNIRFGLTDDMFVRFAASRALSRADMGLYKYYYTIAVDDAGCEDNTVTWSVPGDCNSAPLAWTPRYTGDTGNPLLKPTTADQLDLTYEWYFSNAGSFTLALFYKKFNDYIVK